MGEYRSKKTGNIIPASAAWAKLVFISEWMDPMYTCQQENGLTDEETIDQWWHVLRRTKWPREKVLKAYRLFKEKYTPS